MRRCRTRLAAVLAGVALAGVAASSCGTTGAAGGGAVSAADGQAPSGAVTGEVTVLAAASLSETFTDLAGRFEAAHPGTDVVLSFGGSSGLAQQILSGAPADVFAAASHATMQTVVDGDGTTADPLVFARNRLQVVVPAGNPAGVTGLSDLADPDRTVALCAPQVPCGSGAEQVFAAAGLTAAPDTLEQDVKAVLAKVRLGEVDAGLVYRTDVIAAGDAVEGLDTPEASGVTNDCEVAVLADAPNPVAAQAFVSFLLSGDGRAVLAAAGFETP